MESNKAPDMTFLDGTATRSPPPPDSSPTDSGDKSTYVRFLVSNAAAGSVIGKGGSTITDFQTQSGARIQLSRTHEVFPGTTDRIIMVSGTIDEVTKAMVLILGKLLSELQAEDGNDAEPRTKLRLIVPNSSCGSIIGKGGATIKSFIEESQAGIKISPVDNSYYGLTDRLVTLTGTTEEQMRAFDLILNKLSEDSHYSQSIQAPYSYAGVSLSGFHGAPYAYVLPSVPTPGYNAINYPTNGVGANHQNQKEERGNSVTIAVPDEHIGLVLGRGGRNAMEISQISGARIRISERGDFMSGTTDRKVTITGSQRAIRQAEILVRQKVAYASERTLDQ